MVYIYPTTIITSTGRSTKYGTQELSNKAALCSNSTTLAYWGVKKPTYKGHPLRNYPDSVTTPSGSFYKPEYIYATGWTLKDVANNAIVKKIVIEYKWEQIAYSSLTSFGKFDKPTISIIHNGKTLTSIKGAKPEAIRYNNNKTNQAKMNTNYAELATLHSHTIDVSKYNLTVKDLKKLQIKFNPAKNQASNHCRIVMQFLRLNVTYKEVPAVAKAVEILPLYRVTSKITPSEAIQNEEWIYECTIKSQNSSIKETRCKVDFSDNKIQLVEYNAGKGNSFDANTNTWTVKSFTNKTAKLILKCKCSFLDDVATNNVHKITTTIKQYADSVNSKTTSSVTIVPNRASLNIRLPNEKTPYLFNTKGATIEKCFALDLVRDVYDPSGKITLTTDGWLNDQNDLTVTQGNATLTHIGKGEWEITNIQDKNISIATPQCKEITAGTYIIEAQYTEENRHLPKQSFEINVIGSTLDKEFFKLRLEDGSDVRYNSLMFAPGDDLRKPLTYDIISDNDLKDHMIIKGEEKTIPVDEARYIGFTIELKDTDKTYENVLAYLDVVDNQTGENCFDIIVTGDSNTQVFQGGEHKYCIINELKPNETKKINFVVQSDMERACDIRLKPFNYDYYETIDQETGKKKWTPSIAYFRDMPNVKISVDADKYDLDTNNNAQVSVTYTIENKSTKTFCVPFDDTTNATGYKFKLIEPNNFRVDDNAYLPGQDQNNPLAPQFNEKNRILTLPCIQGATYNEETNQLITHPYKLTINYIATQKGVYDFKICTEDNPLYIDDDQYKNCAKKQVLVNIDSDIKVKTFVSKQRPYVNELIDFTIQVKNNVKPQERLIFDIYDIGSYEIDHPRNDYVIEYADYSRSTFEPSENGNHLGTWTIENVGVGDEYELVLTLRPLDSKYHVIQTILNNTDKFTNLVNVLEPNKKLSFDVYHAIDPTDVADCTNCNALTEICEEDYINLNEKLFYVMSITNNSKNPITEAIHVYARLPKDLIGEGVLCHTNDAGFTYNEETGLIEFTILSLKKCETKKICFMIKPDTKGTYISNFMLTSHNAHTYHKQLKIHVNDEFDAHKLEHEIIIYNFEKTNRYFRYELDGDSNIFKFFNQGNRPTQYVEAEDHKESSVEHYKGSNLKKLLEQISANSKYVEPELLRIGNNKLQDKGYELYPDGFIRRFGLLNSEVYHYAGQMPTVGATIDYAMRWNQDSWDNKVWGGGIYENGVFDLTIDYDKVPTNFDILNISNPIGKLQALVDKVKPFGTQAVCYYSDTVDLKLKTNINVNNSETESITQYQLTMPDDGFDMISLYNRHDNSIAIYYDMFAYSLRNDLSVQTHQSYDDPDNINLSFKAVNYDEDGNMAQVSTDLLTYVDVFDYPIRKKYISDSMDIVQNMYDINTYNNIDITKDYHYEGSGYDGAINVVPNSQYTFEYSYDDNQNMTLHINDDQYVMSYTEDIMNNFKGFVISKNDEIIFKRNLNKKVNKYHMQIETYQINTDIDLNNESVIHFWLHTDDSKFYHIGYITVNNIQDAVVVGQNADTYEHILHKEEEALP